MARERCWAVLLVLLGGAGRMFGQGMEMSLAVPRTTQAPIVDGDLGDAAWQIAPQVARLKPFLDVDNQARIDETPTEVRLCWTPNALFVAFTCHDTEIYDRPSVDERKASLHRGDVCEVFLDPLGQTNLWIELQVNAQAQAYAQLTALFNGVEIGEHGQVTWPCLKRSALTLVHDFELDGLQKAVRRQGDRWTVEIAIPAASLMRYWGETDLRPMRMRANFVRYDWDAVADEDQRKLVGMLWRPVVHGRPHISPGAMGWIELQE